MYITEVEILQLKFIVKTCIWFSSVKFLLCSNIFQVFQKGCDFYHSFCMEMINKIKPSY